MGKLILTLLVCYLSLMSPARAEENDKVDLKKPILYSASLMLIGYPALVALGEVDEPSFRKFKDAFRKCPESDEDSDFYNFVFHPLWGSETYLRAREANFGIPGSIAFSMAASITWEYLIESWSQHPSSQDLIFTTGIGWILGEIRYKLKQNTDKKYHWFIDPLNTILEHINIIPAKEKDGNSIPMVSLRWDF